VTRRGAHGPIHGPVHGPSAWQVARLRARLMVARHRRAVVAGLLALAVIGGLRAVRPADPVSPAASGAAPGPGAGAAARGRDGTSATDHATGRGSAAGRAQELRGLTAVTVRLADPASALVAAPGTRVDVIAGAPLDPLAAGTGRPGSGQPAVVIARGALVLAAPVDGARASPSPAAPAAGPGLPDLLGSGAQTPGDGAGARAGPPSGVVVVAVTPSDALRLAGVAGVRALSLTRADLTERDISD